MAFTDPPYNVAYEGKTAARMTIANDAWGSDFAAFLRAACAAMIGAPGARLCLHELVLDRRLRGDGRALVDVHVWGKNAFTLGRSDYQRQYEPILYGRELYILGVLTMLDRAVLAGYCQAYGRWVEAERNLRETPALPKDAVRLVQQTPGSQSPTSSLNSCTNK